MLLGGDLAVLQEQDKCRGVSTTWPGLKVLTLRHGGETSKGYFVSSNQLKMGKKALAVYLSG